MPLTTADRPEIDRHAMAVHDVLRLVDTDEDLGLSGAVAARRLTELGPNALPLPRGRSWALRVLDQVNHPLIYVLLVAAAVTAALGETVDASVVFAVVVVNAVIGFIQESRAEKALDALVAMVRTEATVLRDGVTSEVSSEDLVVGDIVVLEAGDMVPADLRLAHAEELGIDESALTGESLPVTKDPSSLPSDAVLADRVNMAYSGTLVTAGGGRGVVVATGSDTE
ncbi:MAG TPA: HAD-IC family P-type ATPase, partial [Umezawaea sp.]|nr:HAD-IC family P-type ATPase [Umezawaea sp.]